MSAIKELRKSLRQTYYHIVSENTLRFALDIHRQMVEKGMRPVDLARKIDTSPAYVSKVLRGDANYTVETMAKLAFAMDADLNISLSPKITLSKAEVVNFPSQSITSSSYVIHMSAKNLDLAGNDNDYSNAAIPA